MLYKIYKEISKIIYKYLLILYSTEPLGELNEGVFFNRRMSIQSYKQFPSFGFGNHKKIVQEFCD